MSNAGRDSKRYKLILCDWIEGVWTKTEIFFDTMRQAKNYANANGLRVKIYTNGGRLILADYSDDLDYCELYCM